MNDLGQDFRYALRTLAKNAGFTAVVIVTLALGLGANTAIFGLLDQVLLRPLPVPEPHRLVTLSGPGPFSGHTSQNSNWPIPLSHPMLVALREQNTVFEGIFGHYNIGLHLTVGKQTENVAGDLVTGGYFETLRLRPAAGRLFTLADDRTPGGHPVIVLSHGFWTRRFAADPSVVGRSVVVNGHPMTVVGVAPAGFHGTEVGQATEAFVPTAMFAQMLPTWQSGIDDWRNRFLVVMARLKPGLSLEQATAGVNVLYGQLLQEDLKHLEAPSQSFRTRFLQKKLELGSGAQGTSSLREQSQVPLVVLTCMVGLVLLIACANVANLLLARASSREKEVAVRLALGASRARLVRQLLVESLVLSVAGCLLGIVFAAWTGDLLLRALPFEGVTRAFSSDPDLRMGGFAFALSLLTGLLFGLVPALQTTRPALAPTLKSEGTAVASGKGSFRFRKGLVVAQIALSLLLLIGAGLFTHSLANLRALDPGFAPEHLIAFSLDPSLNGYPLERRLAIFKEVQERITGEPGVTSASMAEDTLMSSNSTSSSIRVEGYVPKEDESMNPNFNRVAPGFFETLGVPLLQGRDFTDGDVAGAPKVAIVNETFARYFFGDQSPVGRRFAMGKRAGTLDITIVGLVRDGKVTSLREKPLRYAYVPYAQVPDTGSLTYYVRSGMDTATLGDRLRRIVADVDASLPVTDLKTMRAQIRESLFVERMVAVLSGAFGVLAMALAAVGLYGVMSYAVSLRTREIGIRVALGAERRAILGLVLREVALLVAIGVAIGLPSGYGLGRLVEAQLFGLTPLDPVTFFVATATLLAAALLAGYVPAARATRVDPMVALRYE